MPSQVVTGDFNGDGRQDVAVLSMTGGTVSILLANADGTLSAARDIPAVTPGGFLPGSIGSNTTFRNNYSWRTVAWARIGGVLLSHLRARVLEERRCEDSSRLVYPKTRSCVRNCGVNVAVLPSRLRINRAVPACASISRRHRSPLRPTVGSRDCGFQWGWQARPGHTA